MVEDVLIKMGMDARPVTNALRGVRKSFSEFKSDLQNNLGSVLNGLGSKMGLALGSAGAIGAIGAAAKAAMDHAHAIKEMSEELGVGTETLQVWTLRVRKLGIDEEGAKTGLEKLSVKIGEARIGTEAAVAAFDRLGISLKDAEGNAKPTERVLYEVADRIKAIQDPAIRAQVAFELFGKSGVKLVGALKDGAKGLEEFKKAASGQILSDADIQRLELLRKNSIGLLNVAKNWAMATTGKIISAWSASFMGDAGTAEMLKRFSAAPQGPSAETIEMKQANAKKVAEALAELEKKRRNVLFERNTEQGKLVFLQKEEKELRERINEAEDGSVEQLKARAELMDKEKQIQEQAEKVEKERLDWNKKNTDEQEKRNKKLEHERDVLQGINDAAANRTDAVGDLANAKGDRSKLTLQDLANTRPDRWTNRDMRQDMMKARQVQWLEQQGKWLAGHGYDDLSKQAFSKADEIRGGIKSLTEHERFPFKSLEKSMEKSESHLKELLRKAAGEGINIVPKNSE